MIGRIDEMTIRVQCEMVKQFQQKHGMPIMVDRDTYTEEQIGDISAWATEIEAMSIKLEQELVADPTNWMKVRMHLVLEEFAELMHAFCERDQVKALDGAADLEYVIKGTLLAFGFEHMIATAFAVVHNSNMTKAVRKADDVRVRDKGASYIAPDVKNVLEFFSDICIEDSNAYVKYACGCTMPRNNFIEYYCSTHDASYLKTE